MNNSELLLLFIGSLITFLATFYQRKGVMGKSVLIAGRITILLVAIAALIELLLNLSSHE